MNGEILRGEIYWVSVDGSIGSEMQTGRTGVVLSGNKRNATSDTVIIAYSTSQSFGNDPLRVGVCVFGKHYKIVCDQIRTVDKQRLTKYVAALSEEEMARVTGAVANALCVPLKTNVVTEDNKELLSLKVELDTMRRMYDMVLKQLVEIKVSNDLERGVEEPKSSEDEGGFDNEDSVEINTCTLGQLRKIGVGAIMADKIMRHRPYTTVEDLKIIPGMTGIAYGVLKNKVYCVPKYKMKTPAKEVKEEIKEDVPVEKNKVNVNTATWQEIVAGTGMGVQTAQQIVSYRKKCGNFSCIEDLLVVPRFGVKCMKDFASMLEV